MGEKRVGYYAFSMMLARPARICVGGLGLQSFEAGRYIYIGSGFAGLDARLARHKKREKPKRWHIDYLRAKARFETAWPIPTPPEEAAKFRQLDIECLLAANLETLGAIRRPERFGASDCGCRGHLLFCDVESAINILPFFGAIGWKDLKNL